MPSPALSDFKTSVSQALLSFQAFYEHEIQALVFLKISSSLGEGGAGGALWGHRTGHGTELGFERI